MSTFGNVTDPIIVNDSFSPSGSHFVSCIVIVGPLSIPELPLSKYNVISNVLALGPLYDKKIFESLNFPIGAALFDDTKFLHNNPLPITGDAPVGPVGPVSPSLPVGPSLGPVGPVSPVGPGYPSFPV